MEKNNNLHVLKDVDNAWKAANEQTKYNEQGQATISKEEREAEEDWG